MATVEAAGPIASTKEQLEAFQRRIPYALVPTNVPGAFASPDQSAQRDPADFIVPLLEPQIGKTHELRGARQVSNGSFTSNNWAGGVLKGPWTFVEGNWMVPIVSKPTEPQGVEGGWNSSSWVGLDGAYGSDDVLQVGVEQRVDASGKASYTAWYEWYCGIRKQTLADTSPLSPALASLNGRLFVAWKGDGNDNLNIMYSADNGQTFGSKYKSPETTSRAPALCVHNGSLYIAWKGDGNDYLNVAMVDMSGATITGLSQKVLLSETSTFSPTLASLNGHLYVAWKGDGNDHLNVMSSSNNGLSFANKYVSAETTPQAPSLCVHDANLYIAWKGDGNDQLNVARVNAAGAAISGFTQKVTLGETSPQTPSLASLNGRLYISWKGDGNDHLSIIYSADSGVAFGNKYISPENSPQFPALAAHQGNLFIGWKGDSNDQLNVSMVGMDGNSISGFTTPTYVYQTNILRFEVLANHTISCTAQYIANNTAGLVTFANLTTGKHFSLTLMPPPGATFSGNCAEWIMEAPDNGYPNSALPKFTDVRFTDAVASRPEASGNPQNGDTWNIQYSGTTLTETILASDAVTVEFKG
ncbi:G1 family glutamic endopeptidase [Caballeronia sp. S22]|uniref:G1 family glutamic endopeptidase n=1 Tax=Caballeronia sp. S22 TaxID=3137182 RepID=UPI0035316754